MRVLQIGDRRAQLVRVNQGLDGPAGISGVLTLGAFTLPANGLTTAIATITSGSMNNGDTLFGILAGVTVILTKSAGVVTAQRYMPGSATISIAADSVFTTISTPLDKFSFSANGTIPTSGFVDVTLILPDLYAVTGQTIEGTIKGVPCTLVKQATAQTWRLTPSRYPASAVSLVAATDYFVTTGQIQTNPLAIGSNTISDTPLLFSVDGAIRSAAWTLWDSVNKKVAVFFDNLGTAYFSKIYSLPLIGGLIDSSESAYPVSGNYLFKICDPSKRVVFGVTDYPSITIGQAVLAFIPGAEFSIADAAGYKSFRANSDGTVEIPALQGYSGGGTVTAAAAWNELSGFWQGYAPLGAVTNSFDNAKAGAATTAEADDFASRCAFLVQNAGASIRAYFAHYSDHSATYFPATFPGGLTQLLSWGAGKSSGNSAVAGQSLGFKRGLINGKLRPTVPATFEGWSDPIALPVVAGDVLQIGVAQNIQGTYRLSNATGINGQLSVCSKSGGFLSTITTRWSDASSPSLTQDSSDLGLAGGLRFIAVKTPIDKMIVVCGDSISRGIYYTSVATPNPVPVHWAGLLEQSLPAKHAVWHQGAGGGRLYTMLTNTAWLDRIMNATHMILAFGTNDFFDNTTAATHQTNNEFMARLATQSGQKVYLSTTPPRNAFNGTQNGHRNTYNTWVRTDPLGFGFIDFDLAIRDPASTDQILAAYDSGDGIHPNNVGQAAMFGAISITL